MNMSAKKQNTKLHDLHIGAYHSSPTVVIPRIWTVLFCVHLKNEIEIVCSQVYLDNKRVKKWWKSSLIAAYRMGLVKQLRNKRIVLTPLGKEALIYKKSFKKYQRFIKIADIISAYNNKQQTLKQKQL